MSRRNTISREFFATIAAVLVLGLSVMCAIQAALSAAYFIGERKSSLTDVLNGATALSERFADEGSIVTKPLQGEDVLERAHSGFELFNTASGALVFIADENGQILLGGTKLLPKKAYPHGLRAAVTVDYDRAPRLFSVTVTVTDAQGAELSSTSFQVEKPNASDEAVVGS